MPGFTDGFVGTGEGYFRVARQQTLGTNWEHIDVRDAAFVARADVQEQLALEGLTSADLVARGILRSARLMSLHATQDAYITDRGTAASTTVNPTDAYLTAPARGPTVVALYPASRRITKCQVRGAGAGTTVQVEIQFDIPPVL